ncbi:MAG: hypothetical protein JO235_15580 [Chroococcidiopsidaceae cyanobacterium CP_BM_RX_35]|nr:hypothetical protein [Chroococcidiopsidaceae cyanobacterium CP_BM_RX_35]
MTEVRELHGKNGDNCWNPRVCRSRRCWYRNRQRNVEKRWHQRHPGETKQESQEQESIIEVPLLEYPVAIIQMYRSNASSDVHAVGAELWIGGKLASKVEPVHCLGLTEGQVKAHLRRVLRAFSEHHGIELNAFGSQVSIDPMACPLKPCPLKPSLP